MKRTGEICVIYVVDHNRKNEFKNVDLGDYYITEEGETILLTSKRLARKYAHLVSVSVYTYKQ